MKVVDVSSCKYHCLFNSEDPDVLTNGNDKTTFIEQIQDEVKLNANLVAGYIFFIVCIRSTKDSVPRN